MTESIKAWVVVVMCGFLASRILSGWLSPFLEKKTIRQWLTVWFLVVTSAFWLHDIWLFYIACFLILTASSMLLREQALYLYAFLIFSLPMLAIELPGFGISRSLFELSVPRILALTVLTPLLIANWAKIWNKKWLPVDRLVIIFVLYTTLIHLSRTDSITDWGRGLFLSFLDILLPYFVLSRLVSERNNIGRFTAAICLSGLIIALVSILEAYKDWLIYKSLYSALHVPVTALGYELQRGGLLRVSSIFASPIINGLYLLFVLGIFLFTNTIHREKFTSPSWIAISLIVAALLSTVSRGPLIGAVIFLGLYIYFIKGFGKLAAYGLALIPLLALVMALVGSDRASNFLGLGETADAGNISYRAQLFNASIPVIERNLLTGSDDFLQAPELQPLRQGQGIIDIVNTYLQISLEYGLLGLLFFCMIFATTLILPNPISKDRRDSKYRAFSVLKALLLSILIVIATVSRIDYAPVVYITLLALCNSWCRTSRIPNADH